MGESHEDQQTWIVLGNPRQPTETIWVSISPFYTIQKQPEIPWPLRFQMKYCQNGFATVWMFVSPKIYMLKS